MKSSTYFSFGQF
uniref:Uncharacterized protein n=1 Tax=Anguilla anguilla TaxID=7936 RepID=A0A0E9PZX6_ANGAN